MRNYDLFGPLTIPRAKKTNRVASSKLAGLWAEAEDTADGLSTATGCYLFGIRAGRGATPWYVRQAKLSFQRECFTDNKLVRYNEVLADHKRGTPFLFLVARMTPGGKFQRELNAREANRLEAFLLDLCLRANINLKNKGGTSFVRDTHIPGLLNSDLRSTSEQTDFLRRLLNLGRSLERDRYRRMRTRLSNTGGLSAIRALWVPASPSRSTSPPTQRISPLPPVPQVFRKQVGQVT